MTRTLCATALLVLALTGCAGEPAAEPSEPSSPTPTASATPTSEPTSEPIPSATPTPTADAAWPPASQSVAQGAQVWGAYVVVTDTAAAPPVAEAHERLAAAGYPSGEGATDIGCDEGAAEALGVDPQAVAVAVYFDTEADAQTFAELYGPDVVGVAQVTLFCLD